MMRPKTYLILAIACVIGIFISFGAFAVSMFSSEFYTELDVYGMIFTIFLYIGMASLFMLLAVIFFIKYNRAKHPPVIISTKQCASCGTTMGAMEMSCPRCFSLQPPDGTRGRR